MSLRRGQGLLEVLISFAILGLGLGASLSLIIATGVESRRTEIRSLATNLGREGIEFIRSLRDTNWLQGDPFDTGFANTGDPVDTDGIVEFDPAAGGWALNMVSDPPPSADAGDALIALLDGVYRQKAGGVAGGSATAFGRVVSIRSICATGAGVETIVNRTDCTALPGTTEVGEVVQVTVRSIDRGKVFTEVLEERLYDWKL